MSLTRQSPSQIEKLCTVCSVLFFISPNSMQKCCSAKCGGILARGHSAEIRYCLICSTPFKTHPSKTSQGNGKYCSRTCSVIANRKPRKTIHERFWSRINIGPTQECWDWQGPLNKKGYGMFHPDRTHTTNAHRYAYIITFGKIPAEVNVCHSCDHPPCCNPAHLWLGTDSENMQDCVKKGRLNGFPKGNQHPHAKLTMEKVFQIRTALHQGKSYSSLAKQYNVSKGAIQRIAEGSAWQHC